MKPGEYIYKKEEDGLYHVCRILRIDAENDTAHVSAYDALTVKPTNPDDLHKTITHAPVRASSYSDWQVFANGLITEDDLVGFYEYLRQVNFGRYLVETNQDKDKLLNEVQAMYRMGCEFHDNDDFVNAITKYRQAFDRWPSFFEAKDNEAFCYMSLGRFEDAINCFKESIDANNHTSLTDFSIGECYFKMGDYKNAQPWFEQAKIYGDLSPNAAATLAKYLNAIKAAD